MSGNLASTPETAVATPNTGRGLRSDTASHLGLGHRRAVRFCLTCIDPSFAKPAGDGYFARSLARQFAKAGHPVRYVSHTNRRSRSTFALPTCLRFRDEIDFVSRGKVPDRRLGKRPLVLWLISQGDAVSDREVESRTHISSPVGCRRLTAKGLRTSFVPQCTDADTFHSGPARADLRTRALFVGHRRQPHQRQVVDMAGTEGVEPIRIGRGWDHMPHENLCCSAVGNDDLRAHRASAIVVRNDHTAVMRKDSFLSNRVCDALACGSRVLTEEMDEQLPVGMDADLVTCTPETCSDRLYQTLDASDRSGEDASEYLRSHHSFAARFETIKETLL